MEPGRCTWSPHVTSQAATAWWPHRTGWLTADDLCTSDRVRLTTPSRTLLDLATELSDARLRAAVHEAEILRLFDLRAIEAALLRCPGHKGVGALGRAIAARQDDPRPRSEAERRFMALVADADLPRPRANQLIEGFEVDFVWLVQRLIVEIDGAATHLTRRAFEDDRLRDEMLRLAGYTVIRFTATRLRDDPDGIIETLSRLLTPAREKPSPSSQTGAGRA